LGIVLYFLAQPVFFLKLGPYLPEWFTTCGSIRFFGRPCPLCGVTRGIDSLLHGRISEAFSYNILSLPVLALLGLELMYRLYASFTSQSKSCVARLAKWDCRIHLAMLAGWIIYSVGFYTQ